MRTAAEKRHNDWKKAIRKKKIINAYGWDYYDNLHPLCSGKTDMNSKNVTISDARKLEEIESQKFDIA